MIRAVDNPPPGERQRGQGCAEHDNSD